MTTTPARVTNRVYMQLQQPRARETTPGMQSCCPAYQVNVHQLSGILALDFEDSVVLRHQRRQRPHLFRVLHPYLFPWKIMRIHIYIQTNMKRSLEPSTSAGRPTCYCKAWSIKLEEFYFCRIGTKTNRYHQVGRQILA